MARHTWNKDTTLKNLIGWKIKKIFSPEAYKAHQEQMQFHKAYFEKEVREKRQEVNKYRRMAGEDDAPAVPDIDMKEVVQEVLKDEKAGTFGKVASALLINNWERIEPALMAQVGAQAQPQNPPPTSSQDTQAGDIPTNEEVADMTPKEILGMVPSKYYPALQHMPVSTLKKNAKKNLDLNLTDEQIKGVKDLLKEEIKA